MPRGDYKIGRKAYMEKYRSANKDRIRRHCRTWRAKNKEQARAAVKMSIYKLTPTEYDRWMSILSCEVCGNGPSGKDKCLAMDHSHTTGRIRGMLCRKCNSALGLANDDPIILRKMAVYLEERRA